MYELPHLRALEQVPDGHVPEAERLAGSAEETLRSDTGPYTGPYTDVYAT